MRRLVVLALVRVACDGDPPVDAGADASLDAGADGATLRFVLGGTPGRWGTSLGAPRARP